MVIGLNAELDTGIVMNTEKWQTIETAPKDGINILMVIDGNIHIGRWEFDCHLKTPKPYWKAQCENWCGKLWMRENQPTHWIPLPKPPM